MPKSRYGLSQVQFLASLKEMLDKHPEGSTPGIKDISILLDEAFQACGYELQLHQHGIAGTAIVALKLEPAITINVQTSNIEQAA